MGLACEALQSATLWANPKRLCEGGWRLANPEDQALLASIAGGEERALEMLYDRYERILYGFAMRTMANPALAEEVVQDVFLKIWRGAGRYDPQQGKVSTWVLSICRHTAVDKLRAMRHLSESRGPEELDIIEDPNANVAGDVEHRFVAAEVGRALHALPVEQREVIELMYFKGMTQNEISQAQGLSLGTVKGRARLALKKLHELLPASRKEADA